MTNALLMANAANAAITQTPRNLAVQNGLDFLFNNGDASLVTEYGTRKFSIDTFGYLEYKEENPNDILFGRCFWRDWDYPPDDTGHLHCSITSE